ncbi:MAG TPA: hypothetical protein VJ841_02660 [Candidatus Saccharimonadales bacterium]|nr:hypothetical protein [Candidatus Saccharimonadales bacterium]
MATSRDDFISGRVKSETIEASAQVLRERVEAAIERASLENRQQVHVLLNATDLPAAIEKVIAEYQGAGWTVTQTGDYREKNMTLS